MKTSKIMTDAALTSAVVSIGSSRQPKHAPDALNGTPLEIQRRLSDLETENCDLRMKQQELQAELAERGKMDEELLVREKLESLGTLAGGLAHNFNNVLTALLGNIQLARMVLQPEDQAGRYLDEALKAGERAKELTTQLVVFAKGGEPIMGTTDIAQLVRGSVNFGRSDSGIGYELVIPEDLWPAKADEDQMKQVIRNLVSNAEQAMPQGGTIRVSCRNVSIGARNSRRLKAGNYVEVTVRDQGSGIAAEHLAKIFDPYFTTRPGSRGLGLATAHSIINKHAGSITVESQSGAGTEVRFCLPAADMEPADKEEITCQGSGRVLIMDDEMPVLELTGSVVRELGYDFELARDGNEALERYARAQQANNPFDLVIMDLTVPGGMGGKETMENLLKIDPAARAIAASGYSNDPVMANHREYGFKGIICKPYDIDKLGRVLTNVLQWK